MDVPVPQSTWIVRERPLHMEVPVPQSTWIVRERPLHMEVPVPQSTWIVRERPLHMEVPVPQSTWIVRERPLHMEVPVPQSTWIVRERPLHMEVPVPQSTWIVRERPLHMEVPVPQSTWIVRERPLHMEVPVPRSTWIVRERPLHMEVPVPQSHGLCESGQHMEQHMDCARAAIAQVPPRSTGMCRPLHMEVPVPPHALPPIRHRHHIVLRHISPISTEQSENTSVAPTAPMTWMARLNRVFGIDLSVCPKFGGKLRVIGEVTEPKAIARILEHAKQRGRHERDPRAPPLLLASLFHLQHVRPALSLAAGLAHWTVRSDFGPVACRATTRRLVGLHRHSLHSA